MAVRIPFTKYTFKVPPIPSAEVFQIQKKALNLIPDLNIEPKYESFLKLNPVLKKGSIIITLIFLVLIIIYVLGTHFFFKPGSTFDTIFGLLLVFYGLGCFGISLSVFFSYNSYSTFKWESKRYYVLLKKLITNSQSYDDFLRNYKTTFSTEKINKKYLD